MTESLLSEKGRRYARYVFLIHNFCSGIKNRFIRKLLAKFVLSMLASFVYVAILKEGAAEHGRTRKTKVSRMQRRTSVSGERNAGEVREVRVSDKGISTVSSLVQASAEGQPANASGEKEI